MLVSVIVPVYKAEKWLHRCVDSILAQTMEDFELLLIDDGSPDRSGEMCDEYAKKDSRVRVFHKENGGVSSARQMGLENAQGEYIIHCDPDDWAESDMLMELTQYAKETQADMVICDCYIENKEKKESFYKKEDLECIDTSYNVMVKLVTHKIHGACWNKLIRRDCLGGIGFYPFDLIYAEDELFNIRVLTQNLKVGYLNKAFYHYVIHKGSITSFVNKGVILSRIKEYEELRKILNPTDFDDFFDVKIEILRDLFFSNNLRSEYGLFQEIYSKIIKLGVPYNPKCPKQYFFVMAIKGYPILSYYLCVINIFFIQIYQRLKKFFILK